MNTLPKYSEWAPTTFDRKGLNGDSEGISNWYVMPTMRTRDSEALDLSNFAVALERLGGESDTVQIHRFKHWACGWFEIILVHPDHYSVAETICTDFDDYPILDEMHYAQTELDIATELGYEPGPEYGWIHPDYPDDIVEHF